MNTSRRRRFAGDGRRLAAAVMALSCSAVAAEARADCTMGSVGITPLTDMQKGQLYKGVPGGLYPDGSSIPPQAHFAAAVGLAAQIAPVNGRIVLAAIGISNTRNEFSKPPHVHGPPPTMPAVVKQYPFKSRADADPSKNPEVVIADGSQGGSLDGSAWADPDSVVWSVLQSRLAEEGVVDPAEVQALWIKMALVTPSFRGTFPTHAVVLHDYLKKTVHNFKEKYPNVKIAYLSSRSRSYATTSGGEPYAFENGFAAKWLIQDQIGGDPLLAYDTPAGTGQAPLLLWGPYLWTDGPAPRSDGLTWICDTSDPFVSPLASDVRAFAASPSKEDHDYAHPGGGGIKKAAEQLLAFFKTYPTTAPWFLKTSVSDPLVWLSTGGVSSGPAPLTITVSGVDATPAHAITEYAFTFDDGTGGLGQTMTKTFNFPGVYRVRMTASDISGNATMRTAVITVTDPSEGSWPGAPASNTTPGPAVLDVPDWVPGAIEPPWLGQIVPERGLEPDLWWPFPANVTPRG